MAAKASPGENQTRWVSVARVGVVPQGEVRPVEVDGQAIALVNREGTYYALGAVCPHRGGPLDQGVLWRGAVECPWHHYRFDPVTGANVYPACVFPDDMPQLKENLRPARVFPVEVHEGRVYVGLPARSAQAGRAK